jgi:hypothetical protein
MNIKQVPGVVQHGFVHFVAKPDKEEALKSLACPLCHQPKPLGVPCCKACWDERADITPLKMFEGEYEDWLMSSRSHYN